MLKHDFSQHFKKRTLSLKKHSSIDIEKQCFDFPLSSFTASSSILKNNNSLPRPYPSSLTPLPSTLRPHCRAKDRLYFWLPANSSHRKFSDTSGSQISIPESHLDRVLDVISALWTEKTKETYGASLLVFHVYCDLHNILDVQRAPSSQFLITAFVASCAGAYSGLAITNYVCGLKAWYLLHGIPWLINADKICAIMEGAFRLAPPSSTRQKRAPFERNTLLCFLTYLDLSHPRDIAIFACLVITFYTVSRLGEFTVPSLNKFHSSPNTFIQRRNVSPVRDHNGLPILSFHIPTMKCSTTGETTQCATLDYLTDPVAWLQNHFDINNPGENDHLFA
jgi:hypothetical protein